MPKSEKYESLCEAFGLELSKSRFVMGSDFSEWFRANYQIDELIHEFWGMRTKSTLIAVTQNLNNKNWKGLVSEWNSFGSQSGQFRLNHSFIKNMLNISLGPSVLPFSLKELSRLETSLFENFFVTVENFWRDYWRVSEANLQGSLNYLVWVTEFENQEIGMLAVGVPAGLVPKNIPHRPAITDIRALASELNVEVPVDLSVGKTRLSIKEVKHIDIGDLVIFEDSDTSRFIWEKNELQQIVINIEAPDRSDQRWPNLYEDLEIEDMIEEQKMHDDLLADLPIELTAQFKGVNMPLQKVMELEAGGVLPLGLLLDSELVLMAPGNKPIAQGELVIMGNQFGLKINRINLKASATGVPQARLSASPDVNPGLLEKSMSAPAVAEPATPQLEAAPELMMEEGEEELDENGEPKRRMTKEEMQELSHQLDQELADIGIDPNELDELEDFGDEDEEF